jgi:hypothetical protein
MQNVIQDVEITNPAAAFITIRDQPNVHYNYSRANWAPSDQEDRYAEYSQMRNNNPNKTILFIRYETEDQDDNVNSTFYILATTELLEEFMVQYPVEPLETHLQRRAQYDELQERINAIPVSAQRVGIHVLLNYYQLCERWHELPIPDMLLNLENITQQISELENRIQ